MIGEQRERNLAEDTSVLVLWPNKERFFSPFFLKERGPAERPMGPAMICVRSFKSDAPWNTNENQLSIPAHRPFNVLFPLWEKGTHYRRHRTISKLSFKHE